MYYFLLPLNQLAVEWEESRTLEFEIKKKEQQIENLRKSNFIYSLGKCERVCIILPSSNEKSKSNRNRIEIGAKNALISFVSKLL